MVAIQWEAGKHAAWYYGFLWLCTMFQTDWTPKMPLINEKPRILHHAVHVCMLAPMEKLVSEAPSFLRNCYKQECSPMLKFAASKLRCYGWVWGHALSQVTEIFKIVTWGSVTDTFEVRFVITANTAEGWTVNVVAESYNMSMQSMSMKNTWKSIKAQSLVKSAAHLCLPDTQ